MKPDYLSKNDHETLSGNRDERYRAKKNRKKWCKGVKGHQHDPKVTLPPNVPGWKKEYCMPAPNWATGSYWRRWRIFCDHVILCTICGKHLGHPEICPTHGETVMLPNPEDSS